MLKRFDRSGLCLFGCLLVFLLSHAAFGAAEDSANNYTPATFINGANEGTGFGAWSLVTNGISVAELRDSTEGSGDINSVNGYSFCFYGDTGGNYVDATRPFGVALGVGDTFSFKMAYNWNGGIRGMSLLRAGGELMYLQYRGGNELAYGFAGGPDTVLNTNYLGDAVLEVTIVQLADNKLDVTLTRSDAWTTNLTSGTLAGPANGIKFYNGGHAGDSINYALFVNDLAIADSVTPALSLSGRPNMPAPYTNVWTVTRNGSTAAALDVDLSSSAAGVASVPASVQIAIGSNSATFEVEGLDKGAAAISAEAAGFPTATVSVAVFDIAYDDSSYYPGTWDDASNGGAGCGAWALSDNDGPGEGFTNYAGAFLGDSTAGGGGNVNAQTSANAFGLYANMQEGSVGGDPLSEAMRPFNAALELGDTVSVDLGVNFRNGAKGVVLQNGNDWLLEVAVIGDDYVYQVHGTAGAQTSLGWDYDANTAIRVEVQRKAAASYDVHIIRSGGLTATTTLAGVNIGNTPDRVRFYNYNTEQGDPNNLFFNRLAIWSGEVTPELAMATQEGLAAGQVNLVVVSRTGSTDDQLVVGLASDDTSVLTVPATVTLEIGEASVVTTVVGVARGEATVTASAAGFTDVTADLEVYDLAYDSSSYYGPGAWVDTSNGGSGFGAWTLSNNDGPDEGFTNYAGAFLGSSTVGGGGDVNAVSNNAFGLYANMQEGSVGGDPLSEAVRPFNAPMALGQQLTVDLGVNFRNGAKGMDIWNGGTRLFEVVVTADQYAWQNHVLGGTLQDLGWDYAADSAIQVQITRVGADKYDIALTRTGSAPEFMLLEGVSFDNQVPDRARFFIWNTDQGDANNLFFNRMGLNQFNTLEMEGVINIDVGGTTTIYVKRSDTVGALTVDLSSAAPSVVTVPATVTFNDGAAVTQFVATGVSESLTTLHAEADGYVGAPLLVNVFDFPDEFDDAGNYIPGAIVPATFVDSSNGGAGFGPWQFGALTDEAYIQLADSRMSTAWMNSWNNRSFGFYGGTNGSYAEATRDLNTALAEGDSFSCVLGMNWSGGNRGLDLQDASGNKLFNFNLSYENVSAYSFGADAPVDLVWGYNATAVVAIVAEQLAGDELSVTITRNDGLTTNVVSTVLEQPAAKVKFYNGGHAGDDIRYTLFVNDLLITRGGGMTDGIPNAWWDKYSIPVGERTRAFDSDGDGAPNGDEFDGDTDPTDITRSFLNEVRRIAGSSVLTLQVGPNTTNSRTYDVWWSEDLMADPQVWTPFGLNAEAALDGGVLNMSVTNDVLRRFFRTGVIIP